MRILITGATGFVGKTLIPHLIDAGHKLCLVVRDRDKMERLFPKTAFVYDYICTVGGDWTEKVTQFNPETTIHLATYFSGCDDIESANKLVESNILFPTLLLAALAKTDCRTFINTCTFTEYRNGDGVFDAVNLYSASKTAFRPLAEFFTSAYKMKLLNIVIYSPYGRNNESRKVIDWLIESLEHPVDFSDGQQVLDFIHVDDIADFYVRLLERLNDLPHRQLFHLGTGQGHSIREVAGVIEDIFGRKLNANWGARPRNPYDTVWAAAPIAANISILDWKSKISLRKGIEILKADIEEA